MMVGGAIQALAGHERCGDAFAWWSEEAVWTLCLVDGLGHGAEAAEAAEAALDEARAFPRLAPDALIAQVDAAIRWSRGAAMAVVRIDAVRQTLVYAGVGNVRAGLFGDTVLRFDGTPGIVGAGRRLPTTDLVSWRDGDMLLLWTDGFDAHLGLDPASRRLRGDPAALAQALVERFSTRRDDAGVLCCLLQAAA